MRCTYKRTLDFHGGSLLRLLPQSLSFQRTQTFYQSDILLTVCRLHSSYLLHTLEWQERQCHEDDETKAWAIQCGISSFRLDLDWCQHSIGKLYFLTIAEQIESAGMPDPVYTLPTFPCSNAASSIQVTSVLLNSYSLPLYCQSLDRKLETQVHWLKMASISNALTVRTSTDKLPVLALQESSLQCGACIKTRIDYQCVWPATFTQNILCSFHNHLFHVQDGLFSLRRSFSIQSRIFIDNVRNFRGHLFVA